MARVQNTLIGRASGSVGMVVFLTWRLLNVTRSKPTSVDNPQTILQQAQRSKFAQTVGLYRDFNELIKLGLINRNRKMSIFNFFQYLNQKNIFQDAGAGVQVLIPENIKLSYGLMTKTRLISLNGFNSLTTVSLSRATQSYGNQSPDDLQSFLFINVTQGFYAYFLDHWMRDDGSSVINLGNQNFAGDEIYAFCFARNISSGLISDTSVIIGNIQNP